MTKQTEAAAKIINNIECSLAASCVSCPEIMMGCILDTAQELVNNDGYVWDVALAKACQIYPCTKFCAADIY